MPSTACASKGGAAFCEALDPDCGAAKLAHMPKGIGLMDSWPIHVSQRDGISPNIVLAGPPKAWQSPSWCSPGGMSAGVFCYRAIQFRSVVIAGTTLIPRSSLSSIR